MLAALALSALMFADAPSAKEMESYRAAEAKAGRDADAHVKLALWCESHALPVERAKHLAMAVAFAPSHAVARGLMGMVKDGGKWRKPDDLAGQMSDAEADALVEYEAKREAAAATADAQWKLSQWCDKQGLKAQAEAHARATVRLDPSRKPAWQRLGYKNHNGRWQTDEQIADERKENEAQERANRVWKARLSKWRDDLKTASKRPFTEGQLAKLSDPRAVPSILAIFGTNDPRDQEKLVQLLGQVDGGPASRFLAFTSLFGNSTEVRRAAAETLTKRDPRDFVSNLIAQIREVRKYEVRPVDGPGSVGILYIEGKKFDIRRNYAAPNLPQRDLEFLNQRNQQAAWAADPATIQRFGEVATTTNSSSERRQQQVANNLTEASRAAESAQRQLERDVAILESENATARVFNDRVLGVLTATTGGDQGADREAWSKWWSDRQGYALILPPSNPVKPVFDQNVPLEYQPQLSHSCFAAGTEVRTRNGPKAIETLRVGDLVLAQDVTAGGLAYEPVVAVFHNPPAATVEVRTDDDAIVATGIHRFWQAGKGWTMARELKPGDTIRTSGGVAKVKAVSARPVQPVFNLEVARGRSFFVGKSGALVHDNSLVETVPQPFDGLVEDAK